MNTLPEGSPSAREPGSSLATLFMALLALAALALIGYFAFAPRPTPEPGDNAIAVEEAGRGAAASPPAAGAR